MPLFDTIAKNSPGERWKDFPDFEGLYKISDYGRIHSLSRWVELEHRPAYFRPGRLIKLRGTKDGKSKAAISEINIQVKLNREKNRSIFSIARYLYYLFVKKFDLQDHTVIIRRKDGNKLNCHYQNLLLVSVSAVARDGFATQNAEPNSRIKQNWYLNIHLKANL